MSHEHHGKNSIIFLTGFMGSGKSTVGPILANTLGFEFMDLDAVLEHQEKMKITDIFKNFGEARFREMERAAVHEFGAGRRLVVALGGGTVVHQPTLDEILRKGVLVYLQSTPSSIFQRLRTKTNRPMLLQPDGSPMSGDQLLGHIETLLSKRIPFYEQAQITICIDNRRVGQTVDTIVKELRGHVNF
jgi:shikimate kinase